MTDYDYAQHRKDCIQRAIDFEYWESPKEARAYTLCDDGTWHLKADSFTWFKTHINICDYEL